MWEMKLAEPKQSLTIKSKMSASLSLAIPSPAALSFA